MPTPILINPDNRVLTWATQDFALFGGQPPAGVIVARANPDGTFDAPREDRLGEAAGLDDAARPLATPADGDVGNSLPDRATAPTLPAQLAAPTPSASSPADAALGAPDDAVQGSSTAPEILTPPTPHGQGATSAGSTDHVPIAATAADAVAEGSAPIGASLGHALSMRQPAHSIR